MSAFFIGHPKETDLALFAGGELGPLSRWRIERHIEGCAECEALVAEYFHLNEELQPLAEVPDLNWDAMARGIERRVAAEEPVEAVRTRVPAMAWAAGLAAVAVISGVVVMRQQPSLAPVEQTVAMESAASPQGAGAFAEMDLVGESRQAAQAPEPVETAERSVSAAKATAAEPSQSDRTDKREFAKEAESPVEMALADELAPPPPPAPGALGDFGAGLPGGRAARRALAPAAEVANVAGPAPLDIQPLFDPSSDVRVASDGWISVRSISAEGRVTITDVYAP